MVPRYLQGLDFTFFLVYTQTCGECSRIVSHDALHKYSVSNYSISYPNFFPRPCSIVDRPDLESSLVGARLIIDGWSRPFYFVQFEVFRCFSMYTCVLVPIYLNQNCRSERSSSCVIPARIGSLIRFTTNPWIISEEHENEKDPVDNLIRDLP